MKIDRLIRYLKSCPEPTHGYIEDLEDLKALLTKWEKLDKDADMLSKMITYRMLINKTKDLKKAMGE